MKSMDENRKIESDGMDVSAHADDKVVIVYSRDDAILEVGRKRKT